jgi:hypothetical protein
LIGQVFMPSSEYAGQTPKQAGQQWHDTDPAPGADDAQGGHGDERDADDDTQDLVDSTDVCFHDGLH